MTAGEDQPQPIVFNLLIGFGWARCDLQHSFVEYRDVRAPPDCVNAIEPSRRSQPGAWIGWNAIARPLFDGGAIRLVERLFRKIEIAQQTHERCKSPPGIDAVGVIYSFARGISVI